MSKLDRIEEAAPPSTSTAAAPSQAAGMRPAFALALLTLASCAAPAEEVRVPAVPSSGATDVVTELYDLVTFGPGVTPDWDAVRALFLEQAVIVLRTGREQMTVFSVDEFVQDFVQFSGRDDVVELGFTERIVALRETVFGDMATVLVRFESEIPGSGREARPGFDSFELIRQGGSWRIVAIVNERVRAGAGELAGLPAAVGA